MKLKIFSLLLLTVIMSACGPTQKITGSWANREALPKGPYKSIFIMVLTQKPATNYYVESRMAKTIISRGPKAVKSNDIFPPKFSATQDFTREQLAEAIQKKGCDAVLTIALLDVNTQTTYHPGTAYYPMNYGHYGSYYGYYNYYYPQVYSPGYSSTDKTYYIECNFYDIASDQLMFSIQSEAYNPKDLESWFDNYSYMLLTHLKKEGLIAK